MGTTDQGSDRLGTGGAVAIGVTGGAVGGLLGGGSGVFFVPALDRFAGLPRRVLHGTSTVANIAVCAIGAAVYAMAGGAIDLRAGSGLIVGGIVGGFFGAGIISRLPERVLRILFVAVVLLTAAKLYLDAAGLDPLSGRAAISPALLADLWFVIPVTLVAGVIIGAWAAALGLGGGLLAVPALVVLFGADLHTAAGTSLLMFVPNSIVGGIMHVRRGTASPRLGRLLSVGAIPGAVVGALLALALDSVVLGLVFGTFALTMGIREIIQMRRTGPGMPTTNAGGRPAWYFREYSPVGVDLATPEAVARYDHNQGTDPGVDDALLDRLGVGEGTTVVDLACGTGSFVVQAARRGADAHGVDVSEEMLRHAAGQARRHGVSPTWHHNGFLDYRHAGSPADVVTTKSALHQLPDMWKQTALCNAADALRPGGTFYLWDAIFSFDPARADEELQRWVDAAAEADGFTAQDFETHVREEFSTYAWIIEGLLDRAGLDVVATSFPRPTHGEFLCRKRS